MSETPRDFLNTDPDLRRMRAILDTPEHRAKLSAGTVRRFEKLIDMYAGDPVHTISSDEKERLRDVMRALGILPNRIAGKVGTARREAANARRALGHEKPEDMAPGLPAWMMGERPPTLPEWGRVRGFFVALRWIFSVVAPMPAPDQPSKA